MIELVNRLAEVLYFWVWRVMVTFGYTEELAELRTALGHFLG